MSITKLNYLDIMAESVKTSVANTDNQNIDEMVNSVLEHVMELDEMNINFNFSPEMIPVVFDEASKSYFVEYDMLLKLHEDHCEDNIEIETKYGKITFEPKCKEKGEDDDDHHDEEYNMAEPGDEPITEEDPYEDEYKNEIDESYMNPFYTYSTPAPYCWEKDALNSVILANIVHDPNRDEIDDNNDDCCCMPEMTMENTYVVIESEDELQRRINSISEAAKSGGIALKNGKAELTKADEAFKNMINHGIKVVKKKSKKTIDESAITEAYWDSKSVRKECKELKKSIGYGERLAKSGDKAGAKKEFDKARATLKRLEKEANMVDDDSAWDLIVRFLVLNGWAVLPIHVFRMIKHGTITQLNRSEAQAACKRLEDQLNKCEMLYFDK